MKIYFLSEGFSVKYMQKECAKAKSTVGSQSSTAQQSTSLTAEAWLTRGDLGETVMTVAGGGGGR